MATLSVSGSATHRHRAERGVVHLSMGFEGDDREKVVRDTIAVHSRLSEQATAWRRQEAATWWSARSVTVAVVTERETDRGEGGEATRASSTVRFRTRAAVDVRFSDFEALASWVGDVALEPGVDIEWVEWSLSHARRPEVEKAVRVAAIADAVTRAGDYAEALGLGRPTLQSVFEPGLRPGAPGGGSPFGLARAAATFSSGGSTTFDLHPDDIEVSAEVSADFVA
ncbi:SIMPL domain-containing protein [Frigoribacterium sp. VKM Ac-2836]|uniref:SIMPL domain-containing protein n=1 Tax=Frigoribacterium sp. VKM Ac-2836 TaxID=2739014 RepID=UPI001563CFA4|nr:SIMPL domain-containing protein [Frigoribacterium sp. VKM Ac-2836]NRD26598.1 SIMPL domain-containing protein [Frigoribacterium sp. VKM Ac-2836]